MKHPLKIMVLNYKKSLKQGITSICSANSFVLEAAMDKGIKEDSFVLVEATSNQVNQFGGYTGMKPKDFANYVKSMARERGLDLNRLILGGDHLGPLIWSNHNEQLAMENAKELVRQFILAGFTKIHIDTSMKLADDMKDRQLSDEVIAKRGAALCAAAEEAYNQLKTENPDALAPVYVVGSEVPIPGGTTENEALQITTPKDLIATVDTFKAEYESLGLQEAWDRVIAVVVQPGVEFGDSNIHEYKRDQASDLVKALEHYPSLVFEGHLTDYQTSEKLRDMVQDGVMILKVGPELTFALREALFMLEHIEKVLFLKMGVHLSNFENVLDNEMLKHPDKWKAYYHEGENELQFKRRFSLSDRCRYYLSNSEVVKATSRLIDNLNSISIPATLLSQYMPVQYSKIRQGLLQNTAVSLIKDRIIQSLDRYTFGCHPMHPSTL